VSSPLTGHHEWHEFFAKTVRDRSLTRNWCASRSKVGDPHGRFLACKSRWGIASSLWMNHCVACTMGGFPRLRGGATNCHFLPRAPTANAFLVYSEPRERVWTLVAATSSYLCLAKSAVCPEKIDQNVFHSISHKTRVILMKFNVWFPE